MNIKDLQEILEALDTAKGLSLGSIAKKVSEIEKGNESVKKDLESILIQISEKIKDHAQTSDVTKLSNKLEKEIEKLQKSDSKISKTILSVITDLRSELEDKINDKSFLNEIKSSLEEKATKKELETLKLKTEAIEGLEDFVSAKIPDQIDYTNELNDLRNSIKVVDGKIFKVPAGVEIFKDGQNMGRFPSLNFIGGTVTASASRIDVDLGSGGGGASAFTDLTDTPSSYAGQSGKAVVVNGTSDGLEFTALSGGGDMLSATYDPANKAEQVLTISDIVDEDDMVSDSATLVPSQQSVKAYVDANAPTIDGSGTSNEFAYWSDSNTLTSTSGKLYQSSGDILASDRYFNIFDNLDTSKKVTFQVSGLTTATSRTKTFQDTDGILAETGNKLSDFASTTSAELAGVISDETGSGPLVFGTSPEFTQIVGIGGTGNVGAYSGSVATVRGTNSNIFEMIRDTSTSDTLLGRFVAGNTSNSVSSSIDFRSGTVNNRGQIRFMTSNGTSNTEALRIDEAQRATFASSVDIGSTTGVNLSATSGVLKIAGLSGTTEDLTIDLSSSNIGTVKSTTGLSSLIFDTISLSNLNSGSGQSFLLSHNGVSYFGAGAGGTGRVGFGGTTSPTAKIHIGAGTTSASTAPLKLTSGSLMTTPEAGAIEFLTDGLYYTNTSAVRREIANLAGTQTFTNKTLTAPKFADLGYIADANGNEMLVFDSEASAVNHFTITNRQFANGPSLKASGDDTNIDILIIPKGSGLIGLTNGVYGTAVASAANINTGTSTSLIVTPDALAGSIFGTKEVIIPVFLYDYVVTTGDGKVYVTLPSTLNGMDLVGVRANLGVAPSTSGTPTIQIARGRRASATSALSFVDVLSTRITVDANKYDSKDATTAAVINTSNDDIATGDVYRIDVDTAGTGTKGLDIICLFRLP